jgi:cell division protein FtsI (penicillin-binding protein 3)
MKNRILPCAMAACVVVLVSCSKNTSTIDPTLQENAQTVLQKEMAASQCDSAVLMVMSVETGAVKAQMKLVKDLASGSYTETNDARIDTYVEPGPIFMPLSLMGAMDECRLSMDDMVETGIGRVVLNNRTIYDEEAFDKGGYGTISLGECLTLPSTVGLAKTMNIAYEGNVDVFRKRMKTMSMGYPSDSGIFQRTAVIPSTVNAFSLGVFFKMTPSQLLTAWNGIANKGKMVAPTVKLGDTLVVNPSMNQPETVKAMQQFLADNGKKEYACTESGVAFLKYLQSVKTTYKRFITGSFCGYYPAEHPKYSCLVLLYYSESADANSSRGKAAVSAAGKRVFAAMVSQP